VNCGRKWCEVLDCDDLETTKLKENQAYQGFVLSWTSKGGEK
jgi:hypothetical protein